MTSSAVISAHWLFFVLGVLGPRQALRPIAVRNPDRDARSSRPS
ncbi:hypothetical protein ACVDG5_033160 [Mesorhizobium sp. ORM6]